MYIISLSLYLQQEWEDDRCRFRLLPRQESVITLQGQGLQNRFFFFIIVLNIWVYREIDRDQGCTGSLFFALGRGGAGEKNFRGGAGQGVKSLGRGGVTVKLRAFSGRGRVTVKLGAFSGWGGAGQGSTLLKLIVFWSN